MAFDTVNHEILMSKLQHNGIRGVMLSWFKSYSCNTKQYVSVTNSSSSMSNITFCVPHGFVLGQYFFFSTSMTCIDPQTNCAFFIFADDTTVFSSDSDINNVYASVNREMVVVDNWLKTNRPSLNVSKLRI